MAEPDKPVTMADLMQFMLMQDERRRQDEDAWHQREIESRSREEEKRRQDEERRHQELLQLQRQRLDQDIASEGARREAARRQEEQYKKEKELERKLRETPPLPKMTEDMDVEMFLADFEQHMADLEIPKERWLTNLRPLLSPWARGTVNILGEGDRRQYTKVKETLLGAYASTKGTLGYRALTTGRQKGQSAAQFLTGIHRRWKHWIGDLPMEEALTKVTMALGELHLPYACKSYIQARKPTTEQDMAANIEQFFAERGSSWDDPRWKSPRPFSPQWSTTSWGGEDSSQRTRQSRMREMETSSQEQTDQQGNSQITPTKQPDRPKERNAPTRGECFNCGRRGHYAARCPDKQIRINKIAAPKLITVPGKIGDEVTDMMLDSGAAMSMFPAKLIDQQDYTGHKTCEWSGR